MSRRDREVIVGRKHLSWRLDQRPSQAKRFVRTAGGLELVPFQLDKVAWPVALDLTLDVHRDGDQTRTIHIEPDSERGITYGHLLNAVYVFLNKTPLSEEDWREVTTALDDDDLPISPERVEMDDFDDHQQQLLSKAMCGEEVHWIDQMGDMVYFEGLVIDPKDNSAHIRRGS